MPQIPALEEHIQAQGVIGAQASPNMFGAQIGEGMQRLAGGISDVGDAIQQHNETQDVTNVHVNMAKARAQWTKTLQEKEQSAAPGDDTFAPSVMKEMEDYFAKGAASATTSRGRQLWTTMSATMTSEFGQRAVGIQAELAARDAVNKYDTLVKSYGSAVHSDPSQYQSVVSQATAAIDDPKGIFAKVAQPVRDKFKAQISEDLNTAASMGLVQTESGLKTLFGSVSPSDVRTMVANGYENIIKMAVPPGGRINVSDGAKAHTQAAAIAGAAKGVNPAVLLAQVDVESGGNAAAVSPKGAEGVSQFMPETAKQYGVDVKDANSSISGQATYMADLLKQYGGDYTKALAAYNYGPGNLNKLMQTWGNDWQNHLPAETANYVRNVMAKAGQVPSQNVNDIQATEAPVVQPQPQAPVKSGLPFFNALPWEKQDAVIKEGIQLQHMRLTMADKERAEQEYQLKKQREEVANGYVMQILDPKTNGAFNLKEMTNNKILSYQEKHYLAQFALSRQRELMAMSESRTNPEEVRRLMTHIHAADDNPTKTYNMDEVNASYAQGRISVNEYRMLRGEVEQMRDGNTSGFGKKLNSARNAVYTSLSRSLMGQVDPAKAADAAYRFNADLETAVAEKRKKNEDPSSLLDPLSRDYMLKPERIHAYMNDAGSTTAGAAERVVQNAAPQPYRQQFKNKSTGKMEWFVVKNGQWVKE